MYTEFQILGTFFCGLYFWKNCFNIYRAPQNSRIKAGKIILKDEHFFTKFT